MLFSRRGGGDLGEGPEADLSHEPEVVGDPCENLLEVGVGGEGGGGDGDLSEGPETDLGHEAEVMGDPGENLLEVGVGGESGGQGDGGRRDGDGEVVGGEGF